MADRTFQLDIAAPDRVILSDTAVSVQAPGVCGAFGVLANHAPLLSELSVGELRYRRENGQEIRLALNGGFLQVFNNQVTVLADSAERADEIDVERARRAREAARQALRDNPAGFTDDETLARQAALERATNRLRVVGERTV